MTMADDAQTDMLDCLIVGGGAAGLMTAVYLGRFRRKALVIDEGASRLGMIPKTRNVIGFPEGIAGEELLLRLRQHAQRYKTPQETGRVERLSRLADGSFEAQAGSRTLRRAGDRRARRGPGHPEPGPFAQERPGALLPGVRRLRDRGPARRGARP